MAVTAVAIAAGAGVALAEDPPMPTKAPVDRPTLIGPAPAVLHGGGPSLAEPYPFGMHREFADDMAKELGLPADRVAAAMRKAIGAQFDRRRDEALECFDDHEKCKGPAKHLPPGRTVRP